MHCHGQTSWAGQHAPGQSVHEVHPSPGSLMGSMAELRRFVKGHPRWKLQTKNQKATRYDAAGRRSHDLPKEHLLRAAVELDIDLTPHFSEDYLGPEYFRLVQERNSRAAALGTSSGTNNSSQAAANSEPSSEDGATHRVEVVFGHKKLNNLKTLVKNHPLWKRQTREELQLIHDRAGTRHLRKEDLLEVAATLGINLFPYFERDYLSSEYEDRMRDVHRVTYDTHKDTRVVVLDGPGRIVERVQIDVVFEEEKATDAPEAALVQLRAQQPLGVSQQGNGAMPGLAFGSVMPSAQAPHALSGPYGMYNAVLSPLTQARGSAFSQPLYGADARGDHAWSPLHGLPCLPVRMLPVLLHDGMKRGAVPISALQSPAGAFAKSAGALQKRPHAEAFPAAEAAVSKFARS